MKIRIYRLKGIFYLISWFFCSIPSCAQTIMSKIQINLPEQLDTIFTDKLESCCSDEDCPAFGYITLVQHAFRHKDEQCEMFLYHSPIGMGRTVKKHKDVFSGSHTLFNRIKFNMKWGDPDQWMPTEQDKKDMDDMLVWLSRKQSKKLFNADCAAVFPMNFHGKKCRGKFSWGRCVVFLSGSGLCYLYFIFTDTARPFEHYLNDIKGAFTLEDCKKKVEPML